MPLKSWVCFKGGGNGREGDAIGVSLGVTGLNDLFAWFKRNLEIMEGTKMDTEITELQINGETYVKKSSIGAMAEEDDIPYCIVRCQGAGVFMAQVVERTGTEATLKNSRRLWYWSGAASLSQLAVEGTKKPSECKFPIEMPEQEVTGVLEVIPMTEAAKRSLDKVPVWQQ